MSMSSSNFVTGSSFRFGAAIPRADPTCPRPRPARRPPPRRSTPRAPRLPIRVAGRAWASRRSTRRWPGRRSTRLRIPHHRLPAGRTLGGLFDIGTESAGHVDPAAVQSGVDLLDGVGQGGPNFPRRVVFTGGRHVSSRRHADGKRRTSVRHLHDGNQDRISLPLAVWEFASQPAETQATSPVMTELILLPAPLLTAQQHEHSDLDRGTSVAQRIRRAGRPRPDSALRPPGRGSG